MHKFMRAIGFSKLTDRTEQQKLITDIILNASKNLTAKKPYLQKFVKILPGIWELPSVANLMQMIDLRMIIFIRI